MLHIVWKLKNWKLFPEVWSIVWRIDCVWRRDVATKTSVVELDGAMDKKKYPPTEIESIEQRSVA